MCPPNLAQCRVRSEKTSSIAIIMAHHAKTIVLHDLRHAGSYDPIVHFVQQTGSSSQDAGYLMNGIPPGLKTLAISGTAQALQ